MSFTKEDAVKRARQDAAQRLGVSETDIEDQAAEEADFPDMALGAAARGEMSGEMITPGWRIRVRSGGETLEYRANKDQLRLYGYKGANHKVL